VQGVGHSSGVIMYRNGVADGTGGGDRRPGSYTGARALGGDKNGAFPYPGDMDEIRIYSGQLEATWLSTEYNNQSSSSTFYVDGAEESKPTSGTVAPTVTTSTASSITQTTATLNGSISATGGEDATQHGFAYGTDSLLSSVIATTTEGVKVGTGSFTSAIASLTAGTTYYLRSYATNSGGTGYGSIESFITLLQETTRFIRLQGVRLRGVRLR